MQGTTHCKEHGLELQIICKDCLDLLCPNCLGNYLKKGCKPLVGLLEHTEELLKTFDDQLQSFANKG